ncbi:hypothetical protein [[Pseudomonas] boreopolis]|uniref:Uncharacterized protein n=1 Tax=Xanthomonas boreopolis TaxID=86183 RepID=A0A919F9V7_9XANT|nr:hypothetical protein GCM10009090_30410 [[Pseudomonas] boreopolis]
MKIKKLLAKIALHALLGMTSSYAMAQETKTTISARDFFSSYLETVNPEEATISIPFALINPPHKDYFNRIEMRESNMRTATNPTGAETSQQIPYQKIRALQERIILKQPEPHRETWKIIIVSPQECLDKCEKFHTDILRSVPKGSEIDLTRIYLSN